jgi:hypothetical protein
MPHRRSVAVFVWLMVIALLVRTLVVCVYHDQLEDDPDMYLRIAHQFAADAGYLHSDTGVSPTAYRPPLYPLVLSQVLRFHQGWRGVAVLHVLLSLATVALTWVAGRHLFCERHAATSSGDVIQTDRSCGIAWSAFFAAGWLTFDPLLLQNETLVMTETLAAFLVSLLLWRMVCGVNTGASAFQLGVIFGLSCLCRPTFWVFGGLLAFVWLARRFELRRRSGPSASQASQAESSTHDAQFVSDARPGIVDSRLIAAFVCLGTVVTVAPWVVSNQITFRQPILTTTHGGYTLLLAHNPVYYREVVEQPWGTVWSRESLTAWQASLRKRMPHTKAYLTPEPSQDQWMYQQAWQNIADDPGMAVRAGVTLLGRFWGVMPLNTPERSLPTALRWSIGVFYAVQFVAMALGVWRLRRDEWSRWWPLVALIVSFTCVHSMYWADMRMRAPLVPAIALLAARGLRGSLGVDRVSGRRGDAARA